MDVLEFKLRGETAFFKIPEVNTYRYLTYSSIHKVALLGMLGAIVGLKGYGYENKENDFPEFYERLKDIMLSIEINDIGNIRKKFQKFNNSVGYASDEQGNNLIVTEQWLEKPSWTIRILKDSIPRDIPISEYLLKKRAVYIPYLGKNDHFATIEDVKIVPAKRLENLLDRFVISSLFDESLFEIKLKLGESARFYKYTEHLPVGIDEEFNHYELSPMIQTSGSLENVGGTNNLEQLYSIEDKLYYFF